MAEGKTILCETCSSSISRYCCPGCNIRSCSLGCVRKHKVATGCSGKRNVTQFVPLSQYTDSNLRSDYFFLENVIRFTESVSRDKLSKKANLQRPRKKRQFETLKRAAKAHGVTLFMAPVILTRHKTNTSRVSYDGINGTVIHWKIQWHFIESYQDYTDKNISERILLQDLLDRYLHPTSSNPLVRHRLRAYVACPPANIKVFMKVERSRGKRLYHLLDKSLSLADNLNGRFMVEHPELWVTCSLEREKDYPVLGTRRRREEEEEEEEEGELVVVDEEEEAEIQGEDIASDSSRVNDECTLAEKEENIRGQLLVTPQIKDNNNNSSYALQLISLYNES